MSTSRALFMTLMSLISCPSVSFASRTFPLASAQIHRYRSKTAAEYPSGLRGRIANPLFVGSNPTSACLIRLFIPHVHRHRRHFLFFAVIAVDERLHVGQRLAGGLSAPGKHGG